MTTSVIFPVTEQVPPKKMILDARGIFKGWAITSIFKVLVRVSHKSNESKNSLNYIYLMKLGGNTFIDLSTSERFRLKTAKGSQTIAFRNISSNPDKYCLYVYEVHNCDSILNIGEGVRLYAS